MKRWFVLMVILLFFVTGCSGGKAPAGPSLPDVGGGGPSLPGGGGPSNGGPSLPGGSGPAGNGQAGPATIGVSFGGPAGGGAAGPQTVGAVGMSQAGFGGQGQYGGSANLRQANDLSFGGPSPAGPGAGNGAGPGAGNGVGPGAGNGVGPGAGNGVGPGAGNGNTPLNNPLLSGGTDGPFELRPDGRTGLGNLTELLPKGFTFANGQLTIPDATALLENLDTAAEAQGQAQEVITKAGETTQEAIDQAQENAQAAYEQLWEDYYAAVDYAAQAYYDSVTSAIDYGAATFEEYYNQAVSDAYAVVDYYYDYYYDYAAYCELYPWDCYQYTYDETSQSYVSDEAVNNYYYNYYYGTATPTAETIPTTQVTSPSLAAAPPISLPEPSAEAYEAIVVFANDQLGAVVTPVYAGEVTGELLALLQQLPVYVQNATYGATQFATASYYGLLQGGAAVVSVGECPAGTSCTLDDIPAELSEASLGVYLLQTAEAMPTSEGQALQLIQLVYPKLTGLPFSEVESSDGSIPGYAFTATTTSAALVNGQPAFVTKVVFAGVMNVNGYTVVYTAVGIGSAYASLLPQ